MQVKIKLNSDEALYAVRLYYANKLNLNDTYDIELEMEKPEPEIQVKYITRMFDIPPPLEIKRVVGLIWDNTPIPPENKINQIKMFREQFREQFNWNIPLHYAKVACENWVQFRTLVFDIGMLPVEFNDSQLWNNWKPTA